MFLIIDNYDSFTYNLYQYMGEVLEEKGNNEIKVIRNDKTTIEEIERMNPKGIIISPGPGTPEDSGISIEVVKKLGKGIPILGICLGHQVISKAFGAEVVRAKEIKHGKISSINHSGTGVFENVKSPLNVMRYHSLIVKKDSISSDLTITAETEDGVVMGVKHREYPIFGLQFHPESISSEEGKRIIRNFVEVICGD